MKNLKKYYNIPADPQDVYTALTNPFTIELWTGEKAIMSEEEGFEFNLWNGDIVGKNITIEPNVRIVQQWYFGDEDEDNPSIVNIKLWEVKGGTSVELLHTNIPDEAFENIINGWDEAYFGAIAKLFEV
ncbi:MAG: SRPBCC domain-containing protein [Bacteroidales bacterium]|nr:SRPBCC domain-containing protein [Bacteroidales bacterium]